MGDNTNALKRQREEVRAALSATRAQVRRLNQQERATARQWVLSEDGRWDTPGSQGVCVCLFPAVSRSSLLMPLDLQASSSISAADVCHLP
jgi:hypothetical protein